MMKAAQTLVVLLALAAPLSAQTIRGRVTLQADGSPLPGVTVSVADMNASTVTDAEGNYVLSVPGGSNRGAVRVTAALEGFQTRTTTVDVARGDARQDFSLRVAFGQEITVGSRAIGADTEKAVPVDVITAEQIQATPSTETNQIIQKMAASFNFPRPTITDGTDTVRPATLRGLGPDQLLVMVNGKRRHASALVNANNSVGRGSSGVDLNAIPASAIQEIEILREGAAAQYGSDAIAGVINLVMKSDAEPLRLSVKAGMTTHDDGEVLDTSLSGGWRIGRGALFATTEFRTRYETNRAGPDPRPQIVNGDQGNNAVPQPNHHWGDSYARDWLVFANLNLPMTEDGKQIFYAFGGYGLRHGSHGGFYRRALDARNHPQIYPLGFLPLIEPRVADDAITAGARGELATWFYDLSAGYGHNKFDFYVSDSLNASLGPAVPPNQTKFYAGSLADDLLNVNLDVSRQFRAGLAGPLNVAAGVEFRRDGFEIQAGEPASYIDGGMPDQFGGKAAPGAQVFPGFRPSNEIDASRNSKAIYIDVEGDVLEQLRLGVAGRFEDYSDFGTTTNGKLTARYSPMQSLIFRGSASTGFRAPSLSQSYYSAVSTNFLRGASGELEPFEVGTYPVDSPIARALGAQPLQPETSRNLSAGVVFQPLANLEVTADVFHIDIEDRIVFSGNFTGPQVLPLIQQFGVTGARFFTNAIDTETTGFDIVANYQRGLGTFGRLDISAAYSHNETEIVGDVTTPPQLAGLGEVLFDLIERRRIECGQPHDNIRLMESWNQGPLNITARQSRYGDYCSFTIAPVDHQTYGAKWLADLEGSYRWADYTFALGIENIFDVFPDENIPNSAQGFSGIFRYPSHSPFGMNGTFIYTRISYTF